MKSHFSFKFCFVLVYVTICVSAVAATVEGNLPVVNICEKGFQYLKSKGLLDDSFPLEKDSAKCQSTTPETMSEVFSHMQEDLKEYIERKLQSETKCATSELSQRQRTLDLLLTIRTVELVGQLSESEKRTQLISPRNELRENLKEIAVKCGVDENEFFSIFRGAFAKNENEMK